MPGVLSRKPKKINHVYLEASFPEPGSKKKIAVGGVIPRCNFTKENKNEPRWRRNSHAWENRELQLEA